MRKARSIILVFLFLFIFLRCGNEVAPATIPTCPPQEGLDQIQETFEKHFHQLPVNIVQYVNIFDKENGPVPDETVYRAIDFWNQCFEKPIFTYDKNAVGDVFISCIIDENKRNSILGFPFRWNVKIGKTVSLGNDISVISLVICEDDETLDHELGHALGFSHSEAPSVMAEKVQRPGVITQGIKAILTQYL